MPRPKWAPLAPGPTNASWRHSAFLNGASTRFETCRDVSFGGVLCALPALAENGLFRHIHDWLAKLRGYYSTLHVIILLAYMALCRIKAVEQLQYQPPGELGKLLGLDRVPEVRCLRRKLAALSIDDGPGKMGRSPVSRLAGGRAGTRRCIVCRRPCPPLSRQTRPRCPNAMSRDSDCACGGPPTTGSTTSWASHSSRWNGRSTTACWRRYGATSCRVCFEDVPGQPTAEELKADRYRARFVIVFDREGYSPEFFKEMWQTHRIACITYHKYPKDDWPTTEFAEIETTLPNGERVSLKLAERGRGSATRRTGSGCGRSAS